jgi:hypothetical protein
MPYEIWWTLAVLAWAVIFLAARLIRQHIRAKEHVAVREMLHRERILALERGVPLPEIPVEETAIAAPDTRRGAVVLATVLIGIGAGTMPAFYLAPNYELHQIWPIGLIPLTVGAACAVSAWMTRN